MRYFDPNFVFLGKFDNNKASKRLPKTQSDLREIFAKIKHLKTLMGTA